MLSVEIDSESYSFHFHGKDEIISTKQENNTINNSEDSQIQSDGTDEQGTEIVSKDLVSIEVKPCSPTKKGEQPSETNVEAHGKCHLKVFNELRPKISRSTSLKTGKTPPGTPRKKIVRFADVLGLDLEDVRHIISGDLPNIPSSAYNDLVLPDEDLPSKVNPSVTYELKGIQCKTWDNIQQGAIGLNTVYPLFDIPGQQPNFMDRVRNTGVCLESLIISDFNVQCTCRVMNWGFTKKVIARYTTDNWLSSNDINASYIVDSSREGTDSFAFTIFLSQQRRDVQFALLYQVNGKEHWDNNNGKIIAWVITVPIILDIRLYPPVRYGWTSSGKIAITL
ncbi:glycogen-binding subunit 76A [Caerostris extrusa]|uniref:Glycogen-binding subunit 76A n=1 Tax=Caerostris extrusa TaxID=172846 RepID=A0AAV4REP9_CAEEX|nr:glycogen-binding subunit 76A [Caerostris extrusa]